MLAFATQWNLLNYFRAVGSGYPVMLQGDVTGKASSLALNKLGLGFNRLGGHFSPHPRRTRVRRNIHQRLQRGQGCDSRVDCVTIVRQGQLRHVCHHSSNSGQ